MKPATFDQNTTVQEIMRKWPATIRVFTQRRMLCVGCPIGAFHTLQDVCVTHGIDKATLVRDLMFVVKHAQEGVGLLAEAAQARGMR